MCSRSATRHGARAGRVATGTRISEKARRLNRHPRLIDAAKALRELLPGDSRFGDPLSTADSEQAQLVARRLATLTAERPGVMRDAGLSALQVWQAMLLAGRASIRPTANDTPLPRFTDLLMRVCVLLVVTDPFVEQAADRSVNAPVTICRGSVLR